MYSRVYILGAAEYTWKQVSTVFAEVLYKSGVIASPVPKSVNLEDAGDGEIPLLMASNMFIRGDRARRLGFKPTQPGFLEHLEEALEGYDLK